MGVRVSDDISCPGKTDDAGILKGDAATRTTDSELQTPC